MGKALSGELSCPCDRSCYGKRYGCVKFQQNSSSGDNYYEENQRWPPVATLEERLEPCSFKTSRGNSQASFQKFTLVLMEEV